MIKGYVLRFFKELKVQFYEVTPLRKLVTFLCVAVVVSEVCLALLANYMIVGYAWQEVLFWSYIASCLMFGTEWPVSDGGLKNHAEGRIHRVFIAVFVLVAVPLFLIIMTFGLIFGRKSK